MWARAHIRRRLAVLAALGLLAGIGGAAALAAVAGARRAASAYERRDSATAAADARVSTFTGFDRWKPSEHLLAPFGELGGVTHWSRLATLAMRPAGSDAYMFDIWIYGAVDEHFGEDINRFQIVRGRTFDHARSDEVVVTEQFAQRVGVDVGDEIDFETWTDESVRAVFEGVGVATQEPIGPVVSARVVGVARTFEPLVPFAEEPVEAYFPSAFTKRYENSVGGALPVSLARLEGGSSGVPEFEAAARELAPSVDPELVDGLRVDAPTPSSAGVQTSIDAQVVALLVFALVAGMAGIVVTYAALGRQLTFATEDQSSLRALGLTRVQRIAGVTLVGVPIAVVASAVSVAGASLASTLLPIGTPGRLEPDVGIRLDPPVLLVGAILVVIVVLALVAVVGISLTRVVGAYSPRVTRRGFGVTVGRWVGFSPPLSLGVGMALDRGRGGRALPVRATIVGCIAGFAGAAAALAFASSLDHLATTPRLYGSAFDAGIEGGTDPEEWRPVLTELEADDDVAELTSFVQVASLYVDGQPAFALLYNPLRGDTLNVIVSGRAPQARDELVMGRAVADRLDVGRGDAVSIELVDGTSRDYTIVGIAAHPPVVGTYREHVALLADSPDEFATTDDGPILGAAVKFRDGVDVAAKLAALEASGVAVYSGFYQPRAVASLDEISVFPAVLAVLLALLAATSLLYALAVGARRRQREFATMRALGFSTRQLRAVSLSQAMVLVAIGLVVGLPLGVMAGRAAWTALAARLGVGVENTLPLAAALWLGAVIAGVALASLVIVRDATHERPAAALRAGPRE